MSVRALILGGMAVAYVCAVLWYHPNDGVLCCDARGHCATPGSVRMAIISLIAAPIAFGVIVL